MVNKPISQIPIEYSDGTKNEMEVHYANEHADKVVLLLPALGVRASYYQSFAKALCQSGVHVCLIDWRGNGKSNIRPSRKVNYGYKELMEDISELIDIIEIQFPNTERFIMGHSLGGQLGSLYSSRFPGKLAGLIHIASCVVYFKGWEGFARFKVWVAITFFYPLSVLVGYFPGKKVGFGGLEARGVMKDWSYNGRSGKYKIAGEDFDYEAAMAQNTTPVLSMSIAGDDMAPTKAVKNLLNKFDEQANIRHEHISSKQAQTKSLNHFNWAKNPAYFVSLIGEWFATQAVSNPQ